MNDEVCQAGSHTCCLMCAGYQGRSGGRCSAGLAGNNTRQSLVMASRAVHKCTLERFTMFSKRE